MLWSHLRGLGNSPLVRASIIVPVVGYLLLLSDWLGNLARLDPALEAFAVGFPWRLVAIYYGSLFLAAGSVTYQLACPRIIRAYEAPVAYNQAEASFQHNLRRGGVELEFDLPGMEDSMAEFAVQLSKQWSRENRRSMIPRLFVTLCFGAGLTLLAIPTIGTLLSVTASVARHLIVPAG